MSWREHTARWWRSVLSLSGRSNRLQFLTTFFGISLLSFVPVFAGYGQTGVIGEVVLVVSLAAMIVVGAPALVQRGHDLGWPARLTLSLVFGGLAVGIMGNAINMDGLEFGGVIACNLTIFALMLAIGDRGPNRFGPAPHTVPW